MSTNPDTGVAAGAERAADDVKDGAQQAKDSNTLEWMARAGLIAYGIVHLLIGWLAIELAVGSSENTADNQGAMRELASTPLGKPLLWLLVIGFIALVIWQVAEAALGHEDEDDDTKRTLKRLRSAGKAIIYAAIGYSAAKIAAGGSSSGDSSKETFTAKLMKQPAGQGLVALVGLAILGTGIGLAYIGWKEKFRKQLEAGATGGKAGTTIVLLGKVGYIAKGFAFAVLGVLFMIAAANHDPKQAGGIDDALKTLLGQPFGPVLVVLIGLGIASFGVYCLARARYLSQNQT